MFLRRSESYSECVGAVAVDLRDDEDVEVVDELRRLGIGAVVAHEALRGLEADARGRDLAGVLLAVEEHADLGAVAHLADAQHVLVLRAARVVAGARRRSLSGEDGAGQRRRRRRSLRAVQRGRDERRTRPGWR